MLWRVYPPPRQSPAHSVTISVPPRKTPELNPALRGARNVSGRTSIVGALEAFTSHTLTRNSSPARTLRGASTRTESISTLGGTGG